MNFREESTGRQAPVSGESPCHTATGSHDANRSEQLACKREDEEAHSTSFTARCVVENLEERTSGRTDNIVNVTGHKEQYDKEDEAGRDTNPNARNHDFGPLNRGTWNLFNQVSNGVVANKPESTLEELKTLALGRPCKVYMFLPQVARQSHQASLFG